MDHADGKYLYRPWDRRPGDEVDPSIVLTPEETVFAVMNTAPPPPVADINQPRYLGYPRQQPGISDVLGLGPAPLMQDTETRQDSGQPGTLRNSTGAW